MDFHAAWLFRSSPLKPVRQELDLKILFAGPESLPRLIEQTLAQEQQCIDELADLTSSTAEVEPNAVPRWPESSFLLIRNWEIKKLESRIAEMQEARSLMKEILGFSGGVQAV